MSRTVLIAADSPVGRHASTRVLNRYLNGTQLVLTDAPVAEAGGSGEIAVGSGLNVDRTPSELAGARQRFTVRESSHAPARETAGAAEASLSAYVEFIGPPDNRWLAALRQLGIRILAYHPENSYLCHGPMARFQDAQRRIVTSTGEPAIRSITELTPDLKTRLGTVAEAGSPVVIVAAAPPEQRTSILAELRALPGVEVLDGNGNDVLDENRLRVRARVQSDGQARLLALPYVLSVEPFHSPVPEDEVAGLILAGLTDASYRPSGSYLAWLRDHGLDGRDVTVGIVDGGVDGSHPAFAGRVRDLTGGQKDWHATMVAGHAAGNYLAESDANGFIYGLGTAPAARILSQDKMQAASFLCRQTVAEANGGPAIQNNSWGKETRSPMDYGSDEALYDAMVRNADPGGSQARPLTICFSSGNSGTLGLTRPKAAKNVIVTGNSESFRPDVGHDGSDDIREVYSGAHGSSYGNCGDGRIRPHVVAPGEWTASANYDCRAGEDEFISPLLTWGGGSSGASPKTAGACALLTQWWRRNNAGASPSPAMLRALVVNGAEPILTGGSVPNNRQGWGRLNVQNVVDPAVSRVMVDQTAFLAQPADSREWNVRAVDASRPMKITLAWTDPPGPIGSGGSAASSPIVNKLALRAVSGRDTYRGLHDRFRHGSSASDDTIAAEGATTLASEGSDNLQNIFLQPSASAGIVKVSVTALNVTTNCLTGRFDEPRQDFALVITNATLDTGTSPSNVVVAVDHGADGPAPANGDGHWADGPGNDDTHLDGSSTSDGQEPETYTSPEDEKAWWDTGDDESPWQETERARLAQPLTSRPEFTRTVDSGLRLTGADPGRLRLQAEGREQALAGAIAQLKDHGEQSNDVAAAPFCPVLVVGRGTRVSAADVHDLRALCSRGVLSLVSDSQEILAFLAQRIGRQTNVRYRLAATAAELPDLVRNTLAEAGGMQPVIVSASRTANGSSAWKHSFDVVAADRAIAVHVRFAGEPRDVTLTRPGHPAVSWSAKRKAAAKPEVSTTFVDGLLQIRVSNAGRTPGAWTLSVAAADADPQPAVSVWALGGPSIAVREGVPVGACKGKDSGDRRLVKISAEPGVSLLKAALTPVSGGPAGETERAVTAQKRPSRLDGPSAEASRPIPVPELSQIVKVPAGASVVDLIADVFGTDAAGRRFARRVRTNLLGQRTPPHANGGTASRGLLRTSGQLSEVKFENGVVSALRLTQGTRSRTVKVCSPALRRALAALDYGALRGRTLSFGVRDAELCSFFRGAGDAVPEATGDRGIEGPVRDVGRPRSEAADTDYPLATRFVRAASFSARPGGRTINRVVIHITDGGARIDGPISWFQNPESRVSAHYIVGQDGEVVQMVRDNDIAWHANSANGDSIGIEHCARAPRPGSDAGIFPTPVQYEASAALVSWLCEQYAIPMDREHILGHSEADPHTSHAACPNSVWDWDYYMEILATAGSVDPDGETRRARESGSQNKEGHRVYYQ